MDHSGFGRALHRSRKPVKLWDSKSGREIRSFAGHSSNISSVAFSPNGRQIISGSGDDTIKLWDVETGHELRSFNGHRYEVNSVAFSTDGRLIVSGSESVRESAAHANPRGF